MGGAKNCPETPRQKMISMMYLVLTAMLALNVSAAILNGYAQVDDSLHATIQTMDEGNRKTYIDFKVALAQNQEKVKPWYDSAMLVKEKSEEFYQYVQNFKDEMVKEAEGSKAIENAKVRDLSKQDDTNVPQRYGINEGNAMILKQKIEEYRDFMIHVTGDEDEMLNELYTLGKKGNLLVLKKSLFGTSIFYSGPAEAFPLADRRSLHFGKKKWDGGQLVYLEQK
jgi:gliding motility-associated protein GldM